MENKNKLIYIDEKKDICAYSQAENNLFIDILLDWVKKEEEKAIDILKRYFWEDEYEEYINPTKKALDKLLEWEELLKVKTNILRNFIKYKYKIVQWEITEKTVNDKCIFLNDTNIKEELKSIKEELKLDYYKKQYEDDLKDIKWKILYVENSKYFIFQYEKLSDTDKKILQNIYNQNKPIITLQEIYDCNEKVYSWVNWKASIRSRLNYFVNNSILNRLKDWLYAVWRTYLKVLDKEWFLIEINDKDKFEKLSYQDYITLFISWNLYKDLSTITEDWKEKIKNYLKTKTNLLADIRLIDESMFQKYEDNQKIEEYISQDNILEDVK